MPRACCDTVNRGLSYADGKLVFGTLDGYVIALDAATGKEDWVVKRAYPDQGETITPAPIIAEDKVFIGFGGDEFAARGGVTAYNLADGKKVWECRTTGSDKDVCLTSNTNKTHPEYGTAGKDLGINTYPGDEWKRGGGAAWGWYGYDPGARSSSTPRRQSGALDPVVSLRRHARRRNSATAASGTTSGRWRSSRATSIPARRSGPTR